MARFSFSKDDSGFSLVEVMIATALIATALVALAQLFAIATQANKTARSASMATLLAGQKMEQLRSLTWGYDILGLPITDATTNTAVYPETPEGGTGLSPSPSDSLQANTDGYVDYLDQYGRILGGGTTIPVGTVYIRRWSIEPLPTNPNDTIIIQVLVTPNRNRGTGDAGSVSRMQDEARLVSVKTRKSI